MDKTLELVKWQFWTIATSNTNLYGDFPLLLTAQRAESMFERHSTQHTRQAQSLPQ